MPRGKKFIPKKKPGKKFWDKEYKKCEHISLSTSPGEDVVKFARWLVRQGDKGLSKSGARVSVLDVGCGNGRNLAYLAREYGVSGAGYDISGEAIEQARELGVGLPLEFAIRDMKNPLPFPNESQDIILDMMSSHFLHTSERTGLLREIVRVLKPGGFLFFKTFLLDEDRHAVRLLREHPGKEAGSYVHPKVGAEEHVYTEEEIHRVLEPHFAIRKILKSHKHIRSGRAWKRRTICAYAEKVEGV